VVTGLPVGEVVAGLPVGLVVDGLCVGSFGGGLIVDGLRVGAVVMGLVSGLCVGAVVTGLLFGLLVCGLCVGTVVMGLSVGGVVTGLAVGLVVNGLRVGALATDSQTAFLGSSLRYFPSHSGGSFPTLMQYPTCSNVTSHVGSMAVYVCPMYGSELHDVRIVIAHSSPGLMTILGLSLSLFLDVSQGPPSLSRKK
jgi:hypothetical protein